MAAEPDRAGIVQRLLEFAGPAGGPRDIHLVDVVDEHTCKADAFVRDIEGNGLAFLLAVIFDQGMRAEKVVWRHPYELDLKLKRRGTPFEAKHIARFSPDELEEIFREPPRLRYPPTFARWTQLACERVCEFYDGDASNIWNDNPRDWDLYLRFADFKGISQKKASMAMNGLVRDFGVRVRGRRHIDISNDKHVRQVLLRVGLLEEEEGEQVVRIARQLNPDYPGALDLPCWEIGRKFCHNDNPSCRLCPLDMVCQKRIELQARGA
jgi:endonuclease III